MTRTSKALKRLGVAGLAVVTIGAGIPAFFATSASAAHATGVFITPETATASVDTCVAYTVQVTPGQVTVVDVQLEQTSTQQVGVADPDFDLQFCNPPAGSGPNTATGQAPGQTTTAQAAGGAVTGPNSPDGNVNECETFTTTNPVPPSGPANQTETNTARCTAEFVTNQNGFVTIGVQSGTPGTVTITAFVEEDNAGGQFNNVGNGNETGDNIPQVGERQDFSTLNVLTNAATAATSVQCTPENAFAPEGDDVDFICTVTGNGTPLTGVEVFYRIISGPDATNPNTDISCGVTGNNGRVTCNVQNNGTPGTDNVYFFVEQNGQPGPQASEPNDQDNAIFTGEARTIVTTPETATVVVGTEQRITAVVRDLNGQPVEGALVRFEVDGPGRVVSNCEFVNLIVGGLASDDDTCFRVTDATGTASVTVNSDTPGLVTVTADIIDQNTGEPASQSNPGSVECQETAGNTTGNGNAANATAGDCTDQSFITYFAAGQSPTPTATNTVQPTQTVTQTATATSTATNSQAPGCTVASGNLPVRINTPIITATGLASVTVTGARPGTVIELQGYSQNHFGTANFNNDLTPVDREQVADAQGTATFSDLRPVSNTRVRAHERGCAFGANNIGAVINVRTLLTLAVSRNGAFVYTFSGSSIPARPGGLIVSLYQIVGAPCAAGVEPRNCPGEVLIGQDRAEEGNTDDGRPNAADAGTYTIVKRFSADNAGRRNFVVKTGQDAQNAPGRSNVRNLLVF